VTLSGLQRHVNKQDSQCFCDILDHRYQAAQTTNMSACNNNTEQGVIEMLSSDDEATSASPRADNSDRQGRDRFSCASAAGVTRPVGLSNSRPESLDDIASDGETLLTRALCLPRPDFREEHATTIAAKLEKRSAMSPVIAELLARGANVNVCNRKGQSPLQLACSTGMCNISELLMRGAHVNQADKDGSTPLFVSVIRGNHSHVRLLLDAGASPNGLYSPLCAALHHHSSLTIARDLIISGTDVHSPGGFVHRLPLMHAVIAKLMGRGTDEGCILLLAAGAAPDAFVDIIDEGDIL
jgi:hypothetical protein